MLGYLFNMFGYLFLDIICSSKLARKAVRFSEQIMSADKHPSIFSRPMGAIVYITRWGQYLRASTVLLFNFMFNHENCLVHHANISGLLIAGRSYILITCTYQVAFDSRIVEEQH